jgi:hypothetical protein
MAENLAIRPDSANDRRSAIGVPVSCVKHSANVLIKSYVVPREAEMIGMAAVEGAIDISWMIPRPVRDVWVHFKDFNSWQSRYGFRYDGVLGDEEGNIVHMADKPNQRGVNVPYFIRKVVPERLLYLDSLPFPFPDKSGAWSGHNVMVLNDCEAGTRITIFMEHTYQSSAMNSAELSKFVQGAVDAAVKFWREFFIPDLEALVMSKVEGSA